MRIRLRRGKQKDLIKAAKRNKTWDELATELSCSKNYLRIDMQNENVLLPEKVYQALCEISGKNQDKFIVEKLEDNWGKVMGGKNSAGSIIKLKVNYNPERLAELIGAILGDGNINSYKKGKKIGVYQIKIAGDYNLDKDYHLNYLKPLSESLFNIQVKEIISPQHNERFLVLSSKELVEFINKTGIKSGNKIKNQSTIPEWIFNNNKLLRLCARGLIDTDGSIFRMSQRDFNLIRINFSNHNHTLLNDLRKAFLILGFHPSKIINNRQFNISRQDEIKKYVKEIGFKNPKHFLKLPRFGIAL